VLNAAAALHVAGVAASIGEGRVLAEQSIDTGDASAVLQKLIAASTTAAERLE
jgi:anthranilate phosphoribosyltransferase